LPVPLRQRTAGATANDIQARDGDASAVVPALCAGRLRQPQGISTDVCRGADGCAFLSGRGLPELQRPSRYGLTSRCSSGTLCRKAGAKVMDFDRRLPERRRLRVSLRQRLPELQRTASRRGIGTRRCSSGTLCRKSLAFARDLARRLPNRERLRVSLRQRTAGATAGEFCAFA